MGAKRGIRFLQKFLFEAGFLKSLTYEIAHMKPALAVHDVFLFTELETDDQITAWLQLSPHA